MTNPIGESPAPAPARPAGESAVAGSIFAYSGFNLLFLGSLAGKLADRLYQMALLTSAFVVFAGAAPENQVAYIQIISTVPLVVAYSLTGTLVDTTDRRRLMSGLMAIKGVFVVGFLPLLWHVTAHGDAAALEFVRKNWFLGLALVFILSTVDAPFGPARAAAVPDVTPLEHRRLGASLMATSGLIALLLGSLLGGYAAQTRHLGPANTILIAAGCFAVSVVLLALLPDAAAVPGNMRQPQSGAAQAVAEKMTLGKYLRELGGGLKYACQTRGIISLVVFETVFWCFGSAYYLL
ncbi:MAG: MFS transporter, partial [Planctomycetota bacterium]